MTWRATLKVNLMKRKRGNHSGRGQVLFRSTVGPEIASEAIDSEQASDILVVTTKRPNRVGAAGQGPAPRGKCGKPEAESL